MIAKLDTGFNIEVEFPLCPFHRRFFAWFIDLVVQGAYLWIGSILISYVSKTWDDEYWPIIIFLLPYIFYHLLCEITMNGQSVGKKAMAIKVMTLEGGQPSISQYLIRWVFRIIDFPIFLILAVTFGPKDWLASPLVALFVFGSVFAGVICVIFTEKSQRIGDLVAGTFLIDLKNRTSWEDTVFTELEATYQPRYPQVMQLSDRDINTLKSIIKQVKKKNDYELSMKIAERIKSKIKMESDQDSLDFLETLLKDYNYYASHS